MGNETVIYLITGTPGSGKTLYAVSTLIAKLAAEKIKNKKGEVCSRRVLIDGIPDLLIPHEVLPELTESEGAGPNGKIVGFTSEGDGLDKWPYWCKPGDIIVIDEVQRYWRPRGLGTKPPEMIKALETHRHFGVDFIIITQNPMLIDQNVRRLIGRHQHVRRILGMARAIIYDWDSCNVVVSNTKGSTSSLWTYPKNAYKLYKSSELHTKQRQKIPIWLALPVLAVVGGFAVAPTAFGSLRNAMSGKGVAVVVPAAAASAPVAMVPVRLASAPGGPGVPIAGAPAPSVPASGVVTAVTEKPEKVGCFASGDVCGCMTSSGVKVETKEDVCRAQIRGMAKPGQKADLSRIENFAQGLVNPMDLDVLASMRKRASPVPLYPHGFQATLAE